MVSVVSIPHHNSAGFVVWYHNYIVYMYIHVYSIDNVLCDIVISVLPACAYSLKIWFCEGI